MRTKLLVSIVLAVACASAQEYDLLLKGGHVIDAKNGINGIRDVAITAGKIAAVSPSIAANQARRVVDVSSLYVTPGLVDIHVHVFADSMAASTRAQTAYVPTGSRFGAE